MLTLSLQPTINVAIGLSWYAVSLSLNGVKLAITSSLLLIIRQIPVINHWKLNTCVCLQRQKGTINFTFARGEGVLVFYTGKFRNSFWLHYQKHNFNNSILHLLRFSLSYKVVHDLKHVNVTDKSAKKHKKKTSHEGRKFFFTALYITIVNIFNITIKFLFKNTYFSLYKEFRFYFGRRSTDDVFQ